MRQETAPIVVVENDVFLRVLQLVLDPTASAERMAAFTEFFEHDLPDFPAWCADLRGELGGFHPADVRMVNSQEELREQLPGASAVVVESLEVRAEELAAAGESLKLVQKFGVILRNIDVLACEAHGVTIRTQRRRANIACAEHTLAMMLAMGRRLPETGNRISFEQLREAGFDPKLWDRRHTPTSGWARVPGLRLLYESTLGIVGMGEIGRELALRAAPFGMRSLYYQRTPLTPDEEKEHRVEYAPLDRLLAESDWVSVQLPGNASTKDMLGSEQLALMKPDAILINTSRPEIIERKAILAALDSGHLGGFALDTTYEIPGLGDDPMLSHSNVLITPWTAAQPRFNALSDLREVITGMARALEIG